MRRALDWTAVLFPLAVSVGANFAWAARDGDVIAVIAGVVTPILLVLAVERWHAHTGLAGWQWWTRLIAMVAVTGVSAAVSWVHTTRLLLEHGWEVPLAMVAPLGVDGLAGLGTLALWSVVRPDEDEDTVPSHQDTWGPWDEDDEDTERDEDTEQDEGEDTAPVPTLTAVPQDTRDEDEDVIAWLVSRDGELPGIGAIASERGIGKTKASRCKAEALRRREEVLAG